MNEFNFQVYTHVPINTTRNYSIIHLDRIMRMKEFYYIDWRNITTP